MLSLQICGNQDNHTFSRAAPQERNGGTSYDCLSLILFMILVSLCNRFLVSLTQDLEREMQLDLARQLEEINKEMDEQLLADLQV